MFNRFSRLWRLTNWLAGLQQQSEIFDLPVKSNYKHTKVLVGTMLSRLNSGLAPRDLRDVEFQVFSQFGDDGIIQYLAHQLPITERTFIEFGVENYTEANTRFLLIKDKWSGLLLDGDKRNIDYISKDPISLLFDVRPRQAFITAENINALLEEAGFTGKIGLLSIDIDGMDYWVWKAITVANPAIVIVEYNAAFGPDRAVTVPYDAKFQRANADLSRLYWGASLGAFKHLAKYKGYFFIGCNGNGNNAYFIRREFSSHPSIAHIEAKFVDASFAEYEINGRRVRGDERLSVIADLPLHNVATGLSETVLPPQTSPIA